MSVHKLKDGRWACTWVDTSSKKQKWKYFGRGLQAEANARAHDESLGLRSWKRRTPVAGSAFFSDLVNDYAKAKLGTNQQVTLDNFVIKMKGVILPELGHIQAIKITDRRVDQYVAKRLEKVKRTTVHRELTDIQAVLNWAVKRKYLSYNPIRDYEKPKRDDEIIRPPSAAEIDALISHAADHLIRALILSFYTGIRPGKRELFSRCWHDVDWSAKTLFVVSAKKGGEIKYRNIPLHQEIFRELRTWHTADRNYASLKNRPMPERIIHYRGKPIESIKKAFWAAKKRAGITRRIRPYDFRHAFATAVLKQNSDLKSTSELLGHSRTDTTTRIYQHTDTEMHRAVIDSLPNITVTKKANISQTDPIKFDDKSDG